MDVVSEILKQITWKDLIGTGLRLTVILFIAWVAMLVLRVLLQRLEKRLLRLGQAQGESNLEAEKRVETLIRLLRQGVVIGVWTVTGLVILAEFGVNVAPVLAGAGVAGLAVGFGAQNLVRDVISGFFMLLENQVRVGDIAIVNGTGGLVEQINFRTIVLRDLSGNVHVFPNGTITTLSNMTKVWSAIVLDIGVAYKENLDRVMEVMRSVGDEMRGDDYYGRLILEDVEIFGVDAFADSAVVIRARLRTRPGKQWEVGREYRRRLKKAFDAEGIEIPFPHRSIYFGEASKPFVAALADRSD